MTPDILGMRLAAARKNAGLTQAHVAHRLTVSKGAVSAWEKGRCEPGTGRLRALARLYGVNITEFLQNEPSPGTPPSDEAAANAAHQKRRSAALAAIAHVKAACARAERVVELGGEEMALHVMQALAWSFAEAGSLLSDEQGPASADQRIRTPKRPAILD